MEVQIDIKNEFGKYEHQIKTFATQEKLEQYLDTFDTKFQKVIGIHT